MLILQRKAGESVFIGEEIEVSVLSVDAGRVRLADRKSTRLNSSH